MMNLFSKLWFVIWVAALGYVTGYLLYNWGTDFGGMFNRIDFVLLVISYIALGVETGSTLVVWATKTEARIDAEIARLKVKAEELLREVS